MTEAARLAKPVRRPNGSILLVGGGVSFGLGVFLLLVGFFMPTISDPGRAGIGDIMAAVPPTYNAWKWPILYIGLLLISVAPIVFSTGLVVRAIFFLPGRAVTQEELEA